MKLALPKLRMLTMRPAATVSTRAASRSAAGVEPQIVDALRVAIGNVRRFHEAELEQSWEITPAEGVRLGQRITPLERVGLYVPGGTAAYPSSIVMNVVPAIRINLLYLRSLPLPKP